MIDRDDFLRAQAMVAMAIGDRLELASGGASGLPWRHH